MVQKSLLVLGIRIAAIFILVGVIQNIPGIVADFGKFHNLGSSPYYWLQGIIPNIALALLAVVMWIKPESLMRKLTPADTPISENGDFSQLSVILFAAIGLYITATALEDISFYYLKDQFIVEHFPGVTVEEKPEDKAGMYTAIFKLAMGIFVMFGSNVLTKFFIALRKFGTEKQ